MEIAGYQSDIKTTTIIKEDTYNAEKSIAEFGVTTGTKSNVYELSLTPKLTKPYEKGLRLQVVFHKPNTGAITLNVDGKGAAEVFKLNALCPTEDTTESTDIADRTATRKVPIPKLGKAATTTTIKEREGLVLEPMEEGDISVGIHYILVYDGARFQMINHVPECNPSTDITVPPPPDKLLINRQEILLIQEDHVDPRLSVNIGRNRYAAINGNLIVARDIRLKRTGGIGKLFGAFIKFPKPADDFLASTPGTILTLQGRPHFYRMTRDGILQIQGEMFDVNDELILNFNPYIAKYPLEFDTERVFPPLEAAKIIEADKKPAKTTRTKTTSTKKK